MTAVPTLHLRQGTRIYGPERQMIQLAAWLPRWGYWLDALVWQRFSDPAADDSLLAALRHAGAHADRMDASWLALPRAAQQLAQRMSRAGYGLAHTHEYKTSILGGAVARRTGLPWVASDHGLFTAGSPSLRLYRALEVRALRHAARVLVPSDAQRRQLQQAGVSPAQIVVVPHGLDVANASPLADGARRRTRSALGVEGDTPLLLAVGRLEPVKAHRDLLAAMQIVLRARPDARLWIAGDGALRPALARQIADAGMASAVTLLGYRADVFALMQAADIFVMPSLFETFGMAALEAMAFARPVVATDVGGLAEIVVHQDTGWLVPPASPRALAEALLLLLDQPGLRMQLGQQGQERARTQFTVERMAARVRQVYDEVLACPSPP